MAMRYRTLKETSKESVGVYRSHIHGRGLFCNRDIEAGECKISSCHHCVVSLLEVIVWSFSGKSIAISKYNLEK